jgi:hypothetical protein
VRDALLNNGGGDDFGFDVVSSYGGGEALKMSFVDSKGVGVDRGLRDEAIWEGNEEEAADEGGDAEEEEVPVEAAGFLQGELLCLRGYAAYILVVVSAL